VNNSKNNSRMPLIPVLLIVSFPFVCEVIG